MNDQAWTRAQLVAANQDAADFYRQQLLGPDGEGPRQYLAKRGFAALLTDDTPWTIGYAPAGWTALHHHLSEQGYSDDCQAAAGLTTMTRRGNPIDRFRDRITFGIRDTDLALLGFVARSSPGAAPHAPKYLNTPTTIIYDKSQTLFGAGEQLARLQAKATPVLVEGPLDAIALERASCTSEANIAGLALCGTGFTAQHVDGALVGAPERVILMFDPDAAGQRALRSAYNLLHSRVPVRATSPAADADPAATLHRDGPSALLRQLEQAKPAADVIIDVQLDSWPATQTGAEADLARLRELAAIVIGLGAPDIAHHAARLRRLLPFDDETVTRELADALSRSSSTGHRAPRGIAVPARACAASPRRRTDHSRSNPPYEVTSDP